MAADDRGQQKKSKLEITGHGQLFLCKDFGFDFVSDGKPSAPEVTRSSRKGLAVRKSRGMRVKAGNRAWGCCRKTSRGGWTGVSWVLGGRAEGIPRWTCRLR